MKVAFLSLLVATIATKSISAQGMFIRHNDGNRVRALFNEESMSMSADYMVSFLLSFAGMEDGKVDKGNGSGNSLMSMGKAGKMGKGSSMMSMGKAGKMGKGGSMMSMDKASKAGLMMSMGKAGKGGSMMSMDKAGKGCLMMSMDKSGKAEP
jgi:hypothetical protein